MAAGAAPEPDLAKAFAACDDLVRAADKDRWLANLFVPEPFRADFMALHAFNAEIAATRDRVSEPLPGEVRLQWWRDVLGAEGRREATGHPVAAALLDVIARRRLPAKPLIDLIDARIFDLYDDLVPTVGDLEGYCGETSSALMQLGALILADGRDPGSADLAGHAGIAYAVAGLLRSFALHAARGQVFIPADILAETGTSREDVMSGKAGAAVMAALGRMRDVGLDHCAQAEALVAQAPGEVRAAFLPLALARLYLDRMDRLIADPFGTRLDVPQWRRQWSLWRTAVRTR
ncbi:phytoene/squalene synthase family protein [Phreatobacter aquaticus]|uniref:Phytoene/squalene synthase family protein n=1 Tax=Phreatobacter aquaticus TaxID=2570229 RepID=A0A4D7QL67_9HYPH|nr:phytoene/squalene synthase family protein [Phreatobacter aquaticus]QCK87321.1 phytoene/squalene synthase family protein [Phreatobacter aquaticus]